MDKILYIIISTICLIACSPYDVRDHSKAPQSIPISYHNTNNGEKQIGYWWEEFADGDLNNIVDQALLQNFEVKQAWHRLRQAAAIINIDRSQLYPQVEVRTGGTYNRFEDSEDQGFGAFGGGFGGGGGGGAFAFNQERYFFNAGLSFEVDLWKRISSQVKASRLRYEAGKEDIKQTMLLLSATIVETWFTAQEQQAALHLLNNQIEVATTLLELTELRFGLGRGSAVDVLQQRQQLAALEGQIPGARSLLKTSLQQLAVLMGLPPGKLDVKTSGYLPELPPFPNVIDPKMLMYNRPDLRSIMLQLQAAEYEIAVAVADRLPRFVITPSYEWATTKISTFFHQEILNIIGNLTAPIFDGGRREEEVERRKAVVDEIANRLADTYLKALLEIENAFVQEKEQLKLMANIKQQIALAQKTLEESKSRYVNGLNDYLTVIVALQNLQNLQRQQIAQQRNLLLIRAQLYRAMGGNWLQNSLVNLQEEMK
ncbi:TolC family protein [Candidatus Uabimicrobium amorphum]|uniref:Membrane protein n=1 Tax=Uabimicrobium amorphum TaxID=2596890 RepID=A0A5S9F3D3_UABAM|nr:TolC family protein [Candidatus Uabimicrobium amorphum]BBM83314.1 membrane protein [Candidatus Uabimicrobium amorphum]